MKYVGPSKICPVHRCVRQIDGSYTCTAPGDGTFKVSPNYNNYFDATTGKIKAWLPKSMADCEEDTVPGTGGQRLALHGQIATITARVINGVLYTSTPTHTNQPPTTCNWRFPSTALNTGIRAKTSSNLPPTPTPFLSGLGR